MRPDFKLYIRGKESWCLFLQDLAEHIRTWTAQLHESRTRSSQTKILLSSLKDIVNSGEFTGVIASKINKVLLFGDLNEYLAIQQLDHDFPNADRALLGILKNTEYESSVRLTDDEKIVVLDTLNENITQKNRLMYEIFGSCLHNGSQETSEENLKKLINCLKTAVNSSVALDQLKEISTDIKKCYGELGKCQAMLDSLAEIKLQAGEPLHSSVKCLKKLNAQATEAKSRELLGDMKTELLSDEGAAALEIIHSKQKEDIEMKNLELRRLREEVSKYEILRNEGFFDFLKEYLDVAHQRKNKEKLKEDYVKGFEIVQED